MAAGGGGGGGSHRGPRPSRHGGGPQPNYAPHTQPPPASPPPPPLPPPLPTLTQASGPVIDEPSSQPIRIYPIERPHKPTAGSGGGGGAAASTVKPFQRLQAVNKPIAVVGFLGADVTSAHGIVTFANRVIGRPAFQDPDIAESALVKPQLLASIQLFYDDARGIAYLLGVVKPDREALTRLALKDPREFLRDLEGIERERRKMELLMFTCSNLVFRFSESGHVPTTILRQIRQLATEKQQLTTLLTASSTHGPGSSKGGKRDKGGAASSSSSVVNAFAPGRCVPLVLFVVPARGELLRGPSKPSSARSRSSTVAFCKAQESMLCSTLRTLRGGIIASARTRDALTAANLSKDRRVFQVDPSHCVVVISRTAANEAGDMQHRLMELLDALSYADLMNEDEGKSPQAQEPPFQLIDSMLGPREEDETGISHAIQHVNRVVDLLFHVSGTSGKDPGVKLELLTLVQWVKAFQGLVKAMHRAEVKRKQDKAQDTGSERGSFAHQGVEHADPRT